MNSWLALITILFVGDSITAGLYVDPNDTFPAIVGDALGVSTENAGCPGSTSRDWTEPPRPDLGCPSGGAWELLAEGVEHHGMVVLLGANDATGFFETWPNTGDMGWGVEPHEYAGRLMDLIERTEAPVLLVTPTRLSPDFPPEAHAALQEYRRAALQVIEIHDRVWLGADGYNLLQHPQDFVDSVHPNEQGLRKIGDALVTTIRSSPTLVQELLEDQGIVFP